MDFSALFSVEKALVVLSGFVFFFLCTSKHKRYCSSSLQVVVIMLVSVVVIQSQKDIFNWHEWKDIKVRVEVASFFFPQYFVPPPDIENVDAYLLSGVITKFLSAMTAGSHCCILLKQ
jgi:hypothetical protein